MSNLNQQLARAQSAQKKWANLSIDTRATYFRKLAQNIHTNLEKYIDIICADNGKPRFEALSSDIVPVLHLIDYYCKKTSSLLAPQEINLGIFKHKKSIRTFSPLGVIGIISPWNFPFSIPMGEIVTALIAGNTVILKPSEITPQIGHLIEESFSHFPEGVFQCLHGGINEGKELVASAVNKIIFTGSVRTGKLVAQECAKSLKPVSLELGGKDVAIVTARADLHLAAKGIAWGAMTNSGQVCASVERILVDKKVAKEFTSLLVNELSQLRQNPNNTNNLNIDLGRITSKAQKEIYQKQINELKPSQILLGGEFDPQGLCLRPTLVKVEGREAIWREETFGPTIAIKEFETIEEAIGLANDSEYGLLSSVWCADQDKGLAIASQIEAGTILINDCVYTHALAETPWFGVKHSGLGSPVHGEEGLFAMVQMKHLHFDRFGGPLFIPPWWFPYGEAKFEFLKRFSGYLASPTPFGKIKALIGLTKVLPKIMRRPKSLHKK